MWLPISSSFTVLYKNQENGVLPFFKSHTCTITFLVIWALAVLWWLLIESYWPAKSQVNRNEVQREKKKLNENEKKAKRRMRMRNNLTDPIEDSELLARNAAAAIILQVLPED